jgi:hypothetical protein
MSTDQKNALRKVSDPEGLTPLRPVLHLSGPKLRTALERLIGASERLGGVERFAEAVRLKALVFQDRLGDGKVASLTRAEFDEIVPLMPTVRRRIGPLVDGRGWAATHAAIVALLDQAHDTTIAGSRIAAFESALRPHFTSPLAGEVARSAGGGTVSEANNSTGRSAGGASGDNEAAASPPPPLRGTSPERGEEKRLSDRFLRDLAAEILHNTLPEHYPLMQRWVWDAKSNSGVIREIWHDPAGAGDDTDRIVLDIPDSYETHLILREELSQFLADNGVFRDMLWHVDLVCAQIYGDYINAQGGAWLKTDFGSESDPLEHTRRILGLDRVARQRATKKTIDGTPHISSSLAGEVARRTGGGEPHALPVSPTPDPSPLGGGGTMRRGQ